MVEPEKTAHFVGAHHGPWESNPIPNFSENVLCDLLRAYALVAGKPAGWSEEIISAWDRILSQREVEEDELEHPILRVVRETYVSEWGWNDVPIIFRGQKGRLIYGSPSPLLGALQKLNLYDCKLPRTAEAFGRRLRNGNYRAFTVLDEERAPELPMLKRTAQKRGAVGLFFSDDSVTVAPTAGVPAVIAQTCAN